MGRPFPDLDVYQMVVGKVSRHWFGMILNNRWRVEPFTTHTFPILIKMGILSILTNSSLIAFSLQLKNKHTQNKHFTVSDSYEDLKTLFICIVDILVISY